MTKTPDNIILLMVALSLCGCTASEKTQLHELGKDASSSIKTLGKDTVKVGQAITSSTKDPGKDKSTGGKDSKPSNSFEKNASKVITSLGKEGDKAEHAVASAFKDLGKNDNASTKSEKVKTTSKSQKQ